MSDKTVEQRLAEYLDRLETQAVEAKKAQDAAARAEAESKLATKDEVAEAVKSLGETIAAQIAEEVAKAMPVARPEGAGRVGEEKTEESEFESNPVAYVAKKAASERTPEEKAFIWELTKRALIF